MNSVETGSDVPWWLEAGPETCPFCQRRFHAEAGYYCVSCDRPLCCFCVLEQWETRSAICPDCREEVQP
ncbi:hypothetical protein SAMN02745148_02664 [Modicisalibacter ilicicola DSM 19980]|uniref:RING-type domain-containing protein n=1 Tax=Modicisalibacter ilicicola DSM 19980 TaxID=1121942 RepID=A0A1M5BSI7_9GAMM|nr:hypothetical protein [Halomonas ilicicola]SHF45415.1 hypothetical protein SAMN02745148_02664 [Halomonas ilicicola DSM 19980]